MKNKRLWNNVYAIVTGKYKIGEMDLNTLGDLALARINRKFETPSVKKCKPLTKEQKQQIHQLYKPYVRHMTLRYHRLYADKSGKFYHNYMPEELYVTTIDRFYTDRTESMYLDNKCYYGQLFPGIKQPELIGMRLRDSWVNFNHELIPYEEIEKAMDQEGCLVVKQASGSEGGVGVFFLDGDGKGEQLNKCLEQLHGDVVIQRAVKQHPQLAKLHKESVNTLRIVSLLTGNQVKVYSKALKIGVGANRTDNGLSGGIYAGINEDGSLREPGYYVSLVSVAEHPDSHYKIADQSVPCLPEAVELVKRAHACVPRFRLISWDIAIDEEGDAVLIEANFSLGAIGELQICNGPLFGEDTKKILDEVFSHKKRRLTTFL